MRHYDFSPLYRSTVGFDRLASLLDQVTTSDNGSNSYPPYNIEATGENTYSISIAVAGFGQDEIDLEVERGVLAVRARKAEDKAERRYLHRGIATRAFERRFHLADHVQVTGAAHTDGMLHIDLERQVPEALKPRRIEIAGGTKAIDKDVVDAKAVN